MSKDMSFCNVAFFAPVEAADPCPAVSSVSTAEFDRTRKTKKSNQKKIFHFRISNIYTAEQCLCSSLHGVKEGHIAEAHVLQHGWEGLPYGQGDGLARLHHVKGHKLLQHSLLWPREGCYCGCSDSIQHIRIRTWSNQENCDSFLLFLFWIYSQGLFWVQYWNISAQTPTLFSGLREKTDPHCCTGPSPGPHRTSNAIDKNLSKYG